MNERLLDSQTPDLSSRPVASVFGMMRILCFNMLTNNFPSISHGPMETTWRPHMLATPFLKMWKFFPEYSAGPSFQSLRDETKGILRRIFKENMNVIGIHSNLYYFYIKFFTGFADNAFRDHCYISCQYLSSVFMSEYHVVG
jgi:hypothetical protein